MGSPFSLWLPTYVWVQNKDTKHSNNFENSHLSDKFANLLLLPKTGS